MKFPREEQNSCSFPCYHRMSTTGSIFVLGSGTSEGVPVVSCLLDPDSKCATCMDANSDRYSKNRRRNTSLAIQVPLPATEYETYSNLNMRTNLIEKEQKQLQERMAMRRKREGDRKATIVIDIGKFFWQSGLDLFPKLGLESIDSILLTHFHIDAIGGLDDLRDWTCRTQLGYSIPVLCNTRELGIIKNMYPYLVSANQANGGGVSSLSFQTVLEPFIPVSSFGLRFIPLPVYHGGSFVSLGFRFGDVVYISDCSAIPDCTTELINGRSLPGSGGSLELLQATEEQKQSHETLKASIVPCKILIIDCLSFDNVAHPSHFKITEVTEYLLSLLDPKPEEIFFTGMCHKVNHEEHSKVLEAFSKEHSLNVRLLYDGQEIPFTWTPCPH